MDWDFNWKLAILLGVMPAIYSMGCSLFPLLDKHRVEPNDFKRSIPLTLRFYVPFALVSVAMTALLMHLAHSDPALQVLMAAWLPIIGMSGMLFDMYANSQWTMRDRIALKGLAMTLWFGVILSVPLLSVTLARNTFSALEIAIGYCIAIMIGWNAVSMKEKLNRKSADTANAAIAG